jgi:hypothetical protein
MQEAAKGLCRVRRISRSGDKSLALLLAEELPPPLLIEQPRPPRPFVSVRESGNGEDPLVNLDEAKKEKGPEWGLSRITIKY